MPLHLFHKAVATWFERSFRAPTEVQEMAWKAVKSSENTLIAAPTGSGKTLAAFLSAIDDLVRQGISGTLWPGTQVVYVSPLKALSNDIEKNLQRPLEGIRAELEQAGLPPVDIRVMVRTGDTPASERSAMLRNPPHILVTTPESLYLLLTSIRGRELLGTVHTLIVDEIHAVAGDKRGAHLALSMERLEALTGRRLHRIGLSATQKPVEDVARFLSGFIGAPEADSSGPGKRSCRIVDTGHSRQLDLDLILPHSPLEAVMSNEVWTEIYDRLINLINSHETTLIFVNTRRLAERLSHQLNERMGPGCVLAHHGSLSREQRLDAEGRLKSGSLKALVATASMELGIDVGAIDLVCQIGSPRSISAFLQRVGRSGHSVDKTPKGRLFPLTLDELTDCVAIIDAIRRGELDRLIIPQKPLDVLAQQIVAEAACRDCTEEELFNLFRKAWNYQGLERGEFDEVIRMLSEGFTGRNGRRGAYLHHDQVNRRIHARKGARLAAVVSGGTIPDNFEYDVMLEPENVFLGTLNEDFAIESLPGDIFQLGNNSWKIRRIEEGKVRVEDAAGQPPNIPFWLGEAPGRTAELSFAVSRLREDISARLGEPGKLLVSQEATVPAAGPPLSGGFPAPGEPVSAGRPESGGEAAETAAARKWKERALDWLIAERAIPEDAAGQLVDHLALAKAALQVMPTQETIVMERFFDEAGDMHLVIHSPFGNRLNKAWGLALRKRFCRKFNFELQAAANDDAIILSLGPTHSFPLEEVFAYLRPETVRQVLVQALLDAPLFGVRWRWNASCALALIRRRGGKKVPPQLQRMQSEDLIAQVFPDQLACLENIAGEREVPDHPLVKQTIHDCLYEAMDIEGLEELLDKIVSRSVRLVARDLKEPSVLAHGILNARPYAFLDDAPLEERRTIAVKSRRWSTLAEAGDAGKLDPEAIEAVRREAWPEAENPDELHDALLTSGFLTEAEGRKYGWETYFEALVHAGRATVLQPPGAGEGTALWVATERLPLLQQIHPGGTLLHEVAVPAWIRKELPEGGDPLAEVLRGRLEISGPVTAASLSALLHISCETIDTALYRLENEGFAFRGGFTDPSASEWCERRLLSRIHRYTIKKLRNEVRPVSTAAFMHFLFTWHGLDAGSRGEGPGALEQALLKLEGFEAPAVAWEGDLLPARVNAYDHEWLDRLCMAGKLSWGRFRPALASAGASGEKKAGSPVRTAPLAFAQRTRLGIWKSVHPFPAEETLPELLSVRARQVLDVLRRRGASFFDDLLRTTQLFPSQAEEALGELISAGLITSDSFTGLRALLLPAKYKTSSANRRHGANPSFSMEYAGRWSLLEETGVSLPGEGANTGPEGEAACSGPPRREASGRPGEKTGPEAVAWTLLRRYGVVFRKLTERERLAPPWRELVRVFRTLEARGQIRGGRFVEGISGEQFALPEAVTVLRSHQKEESRTAGDPGQDREGNGRLVAVSAADPLNLTGILTPGRRVPALHGNRILYRDGVPVAFREGGTIVFVPGLETEMKWEFRNVLIRRNTPPALRKYAAVS